MGHNLGNLDRLLRIILGVGAVTAGILKGHGAGCILAIVGLVLVITGLAGYCFMYAMAGVSTYCPQSLRKGC